MCKRDLNPYQISLFSFHRWLVEKLWKITRLAENSLDRFFSTVFHITFIDPMRKSGKTLFK